MAAIILPHRWRQAPSGRLEIDWNSPLTRDLVAAVPLNTGVPYEACGGRAPVEIVSVPTPVATPHGVQWKFDGTDDQIRFLLDKSYTYPVSLACMFTIDAASNVFSNTAQQDSAFCTHNASVAHETVSVGFSNWAGATATAAVWHHDNTSGAPDSANGSTNIWSMAGQRKSLVGILDSTIAARIYMNGISEYSGAIISRDAQWSEVSIGCRYTTTGATQHATGLIQNCVVFNRGLTAYEAIEYHRNPWQIYKPARTLTYFFPTTSAGGTTYPQACYTSGTGGVALVRSIGLVRQASGTGTATVTRGISKTLTVNATGTPSVLRTISKIFTVNATGTPSESHSLITTLVQQCYATATASVSLAKTVTYGIARSVNATGTATLTRKIVKTLVAAGTGTASVVRKIAKTLTVNATGVATKADAYITTKAASTAATGTVTFARTFIPGSGVTTVIRAVRRALMRFIRRR